MVFRIFRYPEFRTFLYFVQIEVELDFGEVDLKGRRRFDPTSKHPPPVRSPVRPLPSERPPPRTSANSPRRLMRRIRLDRRSAVPRRTDARFREGSDETGAPSPQRGMQKTGANLTEVIELTSGGPTLSSLSTCHLSSGCSSWILHALQLRRVRHPTRTNRGSPAYQNLTRSTIRVPQVFRV